jgi:single-stranded-DNA-specific exonuclease
MIQPTIKRRAVRAGLPLPQALHPVLRRVYAARGIEQESDLDLSLERLAPVSSLENVDAAARLLAEHRNGRVLVIGDFDADGATSTALVVRALRGLGFAHADFLVPNRFRFGYGLTPEIVALAATRNPSLIVTVDNGVSSIAGVAAARDLNIPVLVTDHHLAGASLPQAAVIVNPNLPGSTFSSSALAGVGVAFYVMAALSRHLNVQGFKIAELLDLVAVGTVADVVALDRNNRVLVAQGIKRIRAGRCVPGITALIESAGRNAALLTAADLGFAVGPRLNAAGRLDDMSLGIACLLSDDAREAAGLAAQLAQLNSERREIEGRMQEEALSMLGDSADLSAEEAAGVCLFDEGWHQGVVGLVAGRMKDRLHRPVVAFARGEPGWLRGSARSVPGVHIRDALDAIAAHHPGLLEKFGGHAMAAGMTLREDRLADFRSAFAGEISTRADVDALTGVIYSDGALEPQELSLNTAHALREAGPWGQGFPEPVFDGEFKILNLRIVGEKHLKMQLSGAAAQELDAIAFGYLGGHCEDPELRAGCKLQLAYRLEANEYRGNSRVQLNCQHFVRT